MYMAFQEVRDNIINGETYGTDVNGDSSSDIQDVLSLKVNAYGGVDFGAVYIGDILYTIYVYSFFDSNGSGFGDLNGIVQKIDYIKSLGVTTVILRCIYEVFTDVDIFQEEVTDMSTINPNYGTMQDFENLIKVFHENKIKVLLQNEFQRVHRSHKWFVASRDVNHIDHQQYKDYFYWTTRETKQERGTGIAEDATRNERFWAKFSSFSAYLNLENPDVLDSIYDILVGWVNKGIDGFYFTDVGYMTIDYNNLDEEGRIDGIPPTNNSKNGEIWTSLLQRLKTVNDDLEFHADFGRTPMLTFSLNYKTTVEAIEYLRAGFTNISGIYLVYSVLLDYDMLELSAMYTQYAAYNIQNRFIFSAMDSLYFYRLRLFSSGDSHELNMVKLRAIMTLPGVPHFVHGDELGYISFNEGLEREGLFSAMNWTDEAPLYGFSTNANAKNIKSVQPKLPDNEMLTTFKQMVKLRRLNRAFTLANVYMLSSDKDVLKFQVQKSFETYICVHNFSDVAKEVVISNKKENNNPKVNFFEFITMANTSTPIEDGNYYLFDILNNITLDIIFIENGIYNYEYKVSRYGSLVARLIKFI